MAAEFLECGSEAAAFPGRCATMTGTPAGITRCSQELGAVTAAGQSTRTGTAAFTAAFSAEFSSGLSAPFKAGLNSPLNAQVRPGIDARLAAQFIAGLSVALES